MTGEERMDARERGCKRELASLTVPICQRRNALFPFSPSLCRPLPCSPFCTVQLVKECNLSAD